MGAEHPCCGPCKDRGICAPCRACCLECHFYFEETAAAPYLPAALLERLKSEHRQILEAGARRYDVLEHGSREMAWFREYLPADIVARIENDHDHYERGALPVRETL